MAPARAEGDHRNARARLTLHVTNGDAAADELRAIGVDGEILPWRDVLHDGPVPAGLDAAALREVRARFIAGAGWAPYDAVRADLIRRDETLAGWQGEIVLWFEHDLYDQLQLLQIIDAVGTRPDVTLAQGEDHLTSLSPAALRTLGQDRRAVTRAHRDLSRRAWAAFRAGDPLGVHAFIQGDTSALPHLAPALVRLLEELPWTHDGLSRTEREALRAVAGGATKPRDAFAVAQSHEERAFLGDASFFRTLDGFADCRMPLVRRRDGHLATTAHGDAVLAGDADHVVTSDVDRWLGGAHLRGSDVWRWDPTARAPTR